MGKIDSWMRYLLGTMWLYSWYLIVPLDALLIDSTWLYFMPHGLEIERTHFNIEMKIPRRKDFHKAAK